MIPCTDDGMLHADGLTAKWESVTGAGSYTEETGAARLFERKSDISSGGRRDGQQGENSL